MFSDLQIVWGCDCAYSCADLVCCLAHWVSGCTNCVLFDIFASKQSAKLYWDVSEPVINISVAQKQKPTLRLLSLSVLGVQERQNTSSSCSAWTVLSFPSLFLPPASPPLLRHPSCLFVSPNNFPPVSPLLPSPPLHHSLSPGTGWRFVLIRWLHCRGPLSLPVQKDTNWLRANESPLSPRFSPVLPPLPPLLPSTTLKLLHLSFFEAHIALSLWVLSSLSWMKDPFYPFELDCVPFHSILFFAFLFHFTTLHILV